MKHCDAIDMEITPAGAVFKGQEWPNDINVERNLLDHLPGPHVVFGRMGIIRFTAINGYALYRRAEEIIGGWRYQLRESSIVTKATGSGAKVEPAPLLKAAKSYRRKDHGPLADAFQWLPHQVPPVQLPDWFLGSDFEHKAAEGKLVMRPLHGVLYTVDNGDWVVREGSKIFKVTPQQFAGQYDEV